ncbi:MAG: sialidase family protein [Candidatus Methylacidiphilales bacterium]
MNANASDESNIHALSLKAPAVNVNPGREYATNTRHWQGIPGIERTSSGRLYATWYSGEKGEMPGNYVLVTRSDDDGLTWTEPVLVIDPGIPVRAFDPVLWLDPQGRLWLFWAQNQGGWNGRGGVWFIRTDSPDSDSPEWTAPRRIGNGVMMNKPHVRTDGEWLLPIAVWGTKPPFLPELKQEALSNVFASTDEGETFVRRGGANVPHRCYDEQMTVDRQDGSLWMLVRTSYGIGQSTSLDGGVTWSPGVPTGIAGPTSRFHIRRLASGRLLLVNHLGFTGRSHLTASLSDDDGQSWTKHLLLDERSDVSYPDATVAADGYIRIIYDRERHKAREILFACVTEADIVAGTLVSPGSYLKRLVNKIPAEELP